MVLRNILFYLLDYISKHCSQKEQKEINPKINSQLTPTTVHHGLDVKYNPNKFTKQIVFNVLESSLGYCHVQ